MRGSVGLVAVLVLAAVLAFGLTGTSAAPAVGPGGNAVVDSSGAAGSSAPGRQGERAMDEGIAADGSGDGSGGGLVHLAE